MALIEFDFDCSTDMLSVVIAAFQNIFYIKMY
jgi:hypothetical protein